MLVLNSSKIVKNFVVHIILTISYNKFKFDNDCLTYMPYDVLVGQQVIFLLIVV